jgi:hypothetical protein
VTATQMLAPASDVVSVPPIDAVSVPQLAEIADPSIGEASLDRQAAAPSPSRLSSTQSTRRACLRPAPKSAVSSPSRLNIESYKVIINYQAHKTERYGTNFFVMGSIHNL